MCNERSCGCNLTVREFLAVLTAKGLTATPSIIRDVQDAVHHFAEKIFDISDNERIVIDEYGFVSFFTFDTTECERIGNVLMLCKPLTKGLLNA